MNRIFLSLGLLLMSTAAFSQATAPEIEVEPLTKGVYIHTSYGNFRGQMVPSNGLIVVGDTSVLMVDTRRENLISKRGAGQK